MSTSTDNPPQEQSTEPEGYEANTHPAENVIPPTKPTSSDAPRQLCGYLMKQSLKLPMKTWKPKWFVFDEKRCCLYYYNEKNDFNPQGKIDISMATLSYELENRSKNQFDVLSEGHVTSLQASSNDAMMYWLTQLQGNRRRFSVRRHQNRRSREVNQPPMDDASSGLVGGSSGSQENLLIPSNEADVLSNPLAPTSPPTDLENREAFVSEQTTPSNRSFSTKLRRLARNRASPGSVRKPQFKGHLKPSQEEDSYIGNGSSVHDESNSSVTFEPPETHENKPAKWNRKSMSFWKRPADTAPCARCEQLQETVTSLEVDLKIKEREVNDRDGINEFLRNEIRLTDIRDKAKETLKGVASGDGVKLDVLIQREQTIAQMEGLLSGAIQERDRATTELDTKRQEVAALGEQVALFKEALTAKDHVVVELTNQVFKLEHGGQVLNDPLDAMIPMSQKSYESEIHSLEETVEAYKQQNRFLSSEVVELNAVRAEDSVIFKTLENKHHDLEANYYRIQSKYMILLQESQQPRMGSELGPDTAVVSQMLEEALNSEERTEPAADNSSHDLYGFSNTQDGGYFADPLTVKARKLDQEAQRVTDETVSKRERWDALLVTGRELVRTDDLKRLIRGGIPRTHRSQVWKWMIRDRLGTTYNDCKYSAILREYAGKTSVAVNQIELDLLRTLPTNKFYDSPDAQGINKLRNILTAFSWYDTNVGYCQGLNRLAAIALLFLDEEDAFWCLVAIVHKLLPQDYYSHTLLGSQTDQRVLRDLLTEHAHKIYQHLSVCAIDLSMITFNWFHTIFVDNLPIETMLRIWDTFLYEGSKVLFRFAIAIFKYNEDNLLDIENSIGIFNHLRAMCQDATDVNRLTDIAFNQIGRFPMKPINQKRNIYRLEIKAELKALDALRSTHLSHLSPDHTPDYIHPPLDLSPDHTPDHTHQPSDATRYSKRPKEDDSGSDEETIKFLLPLTDSQHS